MMSSPAASASVPPTQAADFTETQSRFCNWDYCPFSASSAEDILVHWDEVHFPSLKPERVYAKRRKLGDGNWLVLGPEPNMTEDFKVKVKDEPPSQTTGGDITTTTHTTDSYPIPSFPSQLPLSLPALPTELLLPPQRSEQNRSLTPSPPEDDRDTEDHREGLGISTQDEGPIPVPFTDSPFIPPTQPFSQLPQSTPIHHSSGSGDISIEEQSRVVEEVVVGESGVKAVRARAESRVIGFGVAPGSSGSVSGGGTPGRPRVSGDGVGFSWGGK